MYRDGWNEAESSTSGTTATDFGGSANSGMPMNSLFGGASEGTNFSGVPNGGQPFGTQNSSRGEANISAGQGVGAGLSHSRAGSSIQKIVIFYADGTFEAYFHGL